VRVPSACRQDIESRQHHCVDVNGHNGHVRRVGRPLAVSTDALSAFHCICSRRTNKSEQMSCSPAITLRSTTPPACKCSPPTTTTFTTTAPASAVVRRTTAIVLTHQRSIAAVHTKPQIQQANTATATVRRRSKQTPFSGLFSTTNWLSQHQRR